MSDQGLSRVALRAALQTRRDIGAAHWDPVCIYDICDRLGVDVRFVRGTTFEGIFEKNSGTILVPAQRPPGRQAFACAHELGHWRFGHGSRVEALRAADPEVGPQEELAHAFAAYLLMSPWAVEDAVARRHWAVASLTPYQAFVIAGQLGVGYSSLIKHLAHRLELLPRLRMTELLTHNPKDVRLAIVDEPSDHLVVVDERWARTAIDLRVRDAAVTTFEPRVEGTAVDFAGRCSGGYVVRARQAGIARIEGPNGFAAFVRVSRQRFVGRAVYRHLEDDDD